MSARSYVVGLPVVITVTEDGRVLVDVDLSEAGESIREEMGEAGDYDAETDELTPYSEGDVEQDYELVEQVYADGKAAPIEVTWS